MLSIANKRRYVSPFMSTELKLWRAAWALQREEILNVPGVDLGITASFVNLLNKQHLCPITSFSSNNFDELNTENTAIAEEESRGLVLQCGQRNHA